MISPLHPLQNEDTLRSSCPRLEAEVDLSPQQTIQRCARLAKDYLSYLAEQNPYDSALLKSTDPSSEQFGAMNEEIRLFREFINRPDPERGHHPYHEGTIGVHTAWTYRYIQREALEIVEAYGLSEFVDSYLTAEVDGLPLSVLLGLACWTHDWGKAYASQLIQTMDEGIWRRSYRNHEAVSGQLVEFFRNELKEDLRLSDGQVSVIRDLSTHHFYLGKVRREAKEAAEPVGYTSQTVQRGLLDPFIMKQIGILETSAEYPITVPATLFFIGDSLAKSLFFKGRVSGRPVEELVDESTALKYAQAVVPYNERRQQQLVTTLLEKPVDLALGLRTLALLQDRVS